MAYDAQKHHRRSIRLKGYDYSQAGAYFVTVCAQHRACLFGEVAGNELQQNDAGRMVLAEWDKLPDRFPTIDLDAFVVMPNHLHGIIVINPAQTATPVGAGLVPAPNTAMIGATTRVARTVGDIVGAFKSLTTVSYTHGVKRSGWPAFRRRLWQRNYYEHIIRNDESLNRIRQYIFDNPARWASDRENPLVEPSAPDTEWPH